MRRNTEDREADRYERYAGCFQYSCMSNTKWRKILTAIVDSGIPVLCHEIKIIGDTHISSSHGSFSHRDIGEIRINDGNHGPLEYKWIEWMRFPHKIRTREGVGHYKQQDLESIKSAIDKAASVSTEIDGQYLVLYGYKDRINSESMPDTGWE